MKPYKSKVEHLENGTTLITLDPQSKHFQDNIIALSKQIFSKPLTEEECKLFVSTLLEQQWFTSDNVAEFEDFLYRINALFCEFSQRLKYGEPKGEWLCDEYFYYCLSRYQEKTANSQNTGRNKNESDTYPFF